MNVSIAENPNVPGIDVKCPMVGRQKTDTAAKCRREIGGGTSNRFTARRKRRRNDNRLTSETGQYDGRVDDRVVKVIGDTGDAATPHEVRRDATGPRRDREPKLGREDRRMSAILIDSDARTRKRNAPEVETAQRDGDVRQLRLHPGDERQFDPERDDWIEPIPDCGSY